jgi:hypothetical protein
MWLPRRSFSLSLIERTLCLGEDEPGFGLAPLIQNLDLREKHLPLFWGHSLLCVSRSFIDRLVVTLKRLRYKEGAAAPGLAEPGLPWR